MMHPDQNMEKWKYPTFIKTFGSYERTVPQLVGKKCQILLFFEN